VKKFLVENTGFWITVLIVLLAICGVICGMWFLHLDLKKEKPSPEAEKISTLGERRNEVLEKTRNREACLQEKRNKYHQLWQEDCEALGKDKDCRLPLSLILIIEEKIGCQ